MSTRRRFGRRAVGQRTPAPGVSHSSLNVRSISSMKRAPAAGRCSSHHCSILLAWRWACLPTRSFRARSKLGDELEAVHVIAALDVLDALFDRLKKAGALLGLEVVVLDGHEFDLRALGQLGGLVKHQSTAPDVCLECPHMTILLRLAGLRCLGRVGLPGLRYASPSPTAPRPAPRPPPRARGSGPAALRARPRARCACDGAPPPPPPAPLRARPLRREPARWPAPETKGPRSRSQPRLGSRSGSSASW